MIISWGKVRRAMLGIHPREVSFARRGFRAGEPAGRRRLERAGRTFVDGYDAALEAGRPEALPARLDAVEREYRGFAYEGAAMALCLLDRMSLGRRDRLATFLAGPARDHAYMVHVGVGWAAARWGGCLTQWRAALDPLLGWLAVDGFGFHEGYFHWRRHLTGGRVPPGVVGYERRVFDQGFGRSLWFVCGANVEALAGAISGFPARRRPDLWSGAGLACAYAGGVDGTAVRRMADAANAFRAHLAQGAAFAAKARERAGNPADHTELACQILCGLSARDAARVTDAALQGLTSEGPDPAYEVWRCRTQEALGGSRVVAPVGGG